MNILVTGANGQLGNEMRIIAKGSADKYIFTDVVDASEESIAMLKKLAGDEIRTDTICVMLSTVQNSRRNWVGSLLCSSKRESRKPFAGT